MEFEPIDEELEQVLKEIVDSVDECSGYADDLFDHKMECRALNSLGFFEDYEEYIDGAVSVRPTYEAMKYFDRKKRWKAEQNKNAIKEVGGKVLDKGVDFAAVVVAKAAGL